MKDLLEKLFPRVPSEYKTSFNERICMENYQRFLIFGTFFLFHEIITYMTMRGIMSASYMTALGTIIAIHTLILIFFFYGQFFHKSIKPMVYRLFFLPTLVMILGWTIWFTLIIQSSSDRITPYVIGLYMIAVVAYLKPLSSFLMYNTCFLTFLYFLPQYQSDPKVLYPHYLNGFFLNTVAIMTSVLFYRYLLKDFINNEIIKKHNEYLLTESIHDTMTGLYSHQYSYERLEEEIAEAERYNQPLSLLLLDLDKFKEVNDQHGHQFGDHVLETFADLMVKSLRHADLVGRYGGEEFIVIMPNTPIDVASKCAQRLCDQTREHVFDHGLQMTFSGGLVSYNGESSYELIERADRLLYEAKANGRNQIFVG